ncbi:MAG TPA: hypothetical protein VE174_12140 [Actinomycetota bacterium]|nr:hypothetical protein [Actinomycetota bacterium]
MKFEVQHGDHVAHVEWQGPGRVALEVEDESQKAFFERYFNTEQSYMAAAGNHEGMTHEKPTDSEAAFNHAMYQLAAYAYKVRQGDDRRGRGAGK